VTTNADLPVTEADLHAWVDGQLPRDRRREVDAWLAGRPDERRRVDAWVRQAEALKAAFEPVLAEPPPRRLVRAARPAPRGGGAGWRAAAGVLLVLAGGAIGWTVRGERAGAPAVAALPPFAERAAVAHVVYVPEQRRPVEVDAAHEDQLVAWLSKRMGAPMRAPHLQSLGYALEGGRLLPGGSGPVAQFMYRRDGADGAAARLTLYVSRDVPGASGAPAFRFGRQGAVSVFYWVDGPFGYAISAESDRETLSRVSEAVYRQLAAAP